jgi:polyisoprenoid-binding protein YceI
MAFSVDPQHSAIEFTVRHMMIAKVRGEFTRYQATAELDPSALEKSKVRATIDVASIQTGDKDRDAHLRAGDFFDVDKFPEITFASTTIERVGEGSYKLTGDLTIKDVTKPVTFDVEAGGPAKDPWGKLRYGFTLEGKIRREDFGMTWNQVLETGGVMLGKEVTLIADLQVVQSDG